MTLTKEQRAKRVAICQDVLDQVAAGRYVRAVDYHATHGNAYVSLPHHTRGECNKLPSKVCGVCARGALFVSKLRLFNAAPDGATFASDEDPTAELFPDFAHIEADFEQTSGLLHWNDDYQVKWEYGDYDRFPDRLIAIMADIIANDGALVK